MGTYRGIGDEERCQLYALHWVGKTQAEIAIALGVNQATVSRELTRNKGRRGYRFQQAHHKAQA